MSRFPVVLAQANNTQASLDLWTTMTSPGFRLTLSIVFMFLSLWLLLPNGRVNTRLRWFCAAILGLCGLVALWTFIPGLGSFSARTGFWTLALLTISSAVASVTARSPVYCAIWFAVSLLGTAGLFLFQGAQFLGVATVAVYAGAIVVTFLFVLMLAQPEGHSFYDRISWGRSPRFIVTLATVSLTAIVVLSVSQTNQQVVQIRSVVDRQIKAATSATVGEEVEPARLRSVRFSHDSEDVKQITIGVVASERQQAVIRDSIADMHNALARELPSGTPLSIQFTFDDVLTQRHMANLGGRLFSRHLIAVEVVATLLLVALVGAVAIVSVNGRSEKEFQQVRM